MPPAISVSDIIARTKNASTLAPIFRGAAKLKPHFEQGALGATDKLRMAVGLHQTGNLAAAIALYEEVIASSPGSADALHLLGVAYRQLGNDDLAIRHMLKAIAIDPGLVAAWNNLGVAYASRRCWLDAVKSFGRALTLRPDSPDSFFNRANALDELGRLEEALVDYDQALRLQPDNPITLNNRGNILQRLRRYDEALASYERALAMKPDYAAAYGNRGTVFQELNHLDEALADYDKALALRPDSPIILNNRGYVLQRLCRYDEALASYDQALAMKSDYAAAYSNRGTTFQALNRLDDALTNYDRALSLQPDYADARLGRAICLLLAGRYREGWREYEWRWKAGDLGFVPARDDRPVWLGEAEIDGKTILIHSEQGSGDTLQFCRFLPGVAARGASVLLEVQEELLALLHDVPGATQVIARGNSVPDFDYHCPLLSLPLALGLGDDAPGVGAAYLRSDNIYSAKSARWLGDRARSLRVGVVWAGSPLHANNRNRSLPLTFFIDLFARLSVDVFSLQKAISDDDRRLLSAHDWLRQPDPPLKDFADTASLIRQLDLVVTVDTSVAHLTGTLGRPVWVLLPFAPDWRWLLGRKDSPWYGTATLFRQPVPGDWESVLAEVRCSLESMLASGQGPTLPVA